MKQNGLLQVSYTIILFFQHGSKTQLVMIGWTVCNLFLQLLYTPQLIAGLLRDPITSMRGEYISKVPDTALKDNQYARTVGGIIQDFGFKVIVISIFNRNVYYIVID